MQFLPSSAEMVYVLLLLDPWASCREMSLWAEHLAERIYSEHLRYAGHAALS